MRWSHAATVAAIECLLIQLSTHSQPKLFPHSDVSQTSEREGDKEGGVFSQCSHYHALQGSFPVRLKGLVCSSPCKMPLNIKLEFSGGAELLVGNVREHNLSLADQDEPWTIRQLLPYIRDNLLKERPELFMDQETVRPGILVLINDTDWDLLDELDAKLSEGDTVVFISTLHGG
eukprot:m.232390 g.232390  ORF g.232390 m.232390 type:complete len:175 (-) comp17373_c0_seq13:1959-2483(-)